MSTNFAVETAVESLGDGRYGVAFSHDWWVHVGPNGGIPAALVTRACIAEANLDGGARVPRTLTVHYLAPAVAGPAEVSVTVERAGAGVSFLSARIRQGDRLVANAVAALAGPRAEPYAFDELPVPVPPPPDACPVLDYPDREDGPVALRERWDTRHGIGPAALGHAAAAPPDRIGETDATSGGWMRLAEPVPLDHVVIAAMADAWLPPVLALAGRPRVVVPTVELTVHFRHDDVARYAPDSWFLGEFRTRAVAEGFLEEDGEIRGPDGRLVAMSRQLAVMTPFEMATARKAAR